MHVKCLIAGLLLLIGVACSTIAPTPILFGRVTDLNDTVVELYIACSDGPNYVPSEPECNSQLLSTKVDETMSLSVELIRADIKQPQGYDIYLSISMIYFRISQRTLNDYTKAEQIARQFFEIQKSISGKSIDVARFYWPWYAAATSSKQRYDDPAALDSDRKADLLLAAGEGTVIISSLEGPRLVRLKQALTILTFIANSIP